ncbi:MAG: hypothetical protein AAGA71_06405 [Pseudomonadota bacterium]
MDHIRPAVSLKYDPGAACHLFGAQELNLCRLRGTLVSQSTEVACSGEEKHETTVFRQSIANYKAIGEPKKRVFEEGRLQFRCVHFDLVREFLRLPLGL